MKFFDRETEREYFQFVNKSIEKEQKAVGEDLRRKYMCQDLEYLVGTSVYVINEAGDKIADGKLTIKNSVFSIASGICQFSINDVMYADLDRLIIITTRKENEMISEEIEAKILQVASLINKKIIVVKSIANGPFIMIKGKLITQKDGIIRVETSSFFGGGFAEIEFRIRDIDFIKMGEFDYESESKEDTKIYLK